MPAANKHSKHARILAPIVAFAATLVALPGSAVTIPDNPLQTGTSYPPPNIMFILDNSGSMEFTTMPDNPPATTTVDISDLAYTRNTLSYNPSVDYKAWVKADNTRLPTVTYTAAYSDPSLATVASGTIDLSLEDRAYYQPKDPNSTTANYFDNGANYYAFMIQRVTKKVFRGEYGGTSNFKEISWSGFPKTIASTGTAFVEYTFSVTAQTDMTAITIQTSGGNRNGRGADIELVNPSGVVVCSSGNNNNNEECSAKYPVTGTWKARVYKNTAYSNVSLDARWTRDNRCDKSTTNLYPDGTKAFVNCQLGTEILPTVYKTDGTAPAARATVAAELENYAMWYSYFRTRMKAAKAGASEAFSKLNTNMRVGFDTIWGAGRNASAIVYPIPVGTSSGVFMGTNRTNWFDLVQNADGANGTPLHGALQRAGRYFKDRTTTGPWGPEDTANQITCRQNFALLTTDGYWNNDSGYNASADVTPADPTWTAINDSDGVAGETHTLMDNSVVPPKVLKSGGYVPALPYKDGATGRSNTLADVANYYWKHDLRSDMVNNVPESSGDNGFWQHMTTFGISIGLQGRLNPKTDLNAITLGNKVWGNPVDNVEDEDRIDDLWHASVNGHGSFVVARDPVEFARALVDALSTVEERTGSASNVTANSTSFIAGSRIYRAQYTAGKWVGELGSYNASKSGASGTAAWTASAGIPTSGRNIFTWTGTAGSVFPTSTQTTALVRTTGVAPVTGANNAAYITGTRTLEIQNGGTLRNRISLLGDIVNSSPMYVADTNTLYVGANDGMLHAVNASTGAELFTYVPNIINFANLSTLSDPQYVHRYFVDGPVVVSSLKQTPGKNLLVGALGRGGKGLFSLDVTNPTTFGVGNVKWEIGGSDLDMGMVLGDPLIVTLNDTANTKAAIVSNGINSTNGKAVLFVINLTTGVVIKKIDTGVGSDNGLSEPRGRDIDGNGTVDYVYAGDLKGNLWKFDLTAITPSTWNIAGNKPLYKTRSGQPITAGVAIARNSSDGKAWVFFGTGRYLEFSDNSDFTVQTMYGVQDLGDGQTVGESELQSRSIAVVNDVDGDRDFRAFQKNAPLPAGKKGWFINLGNPDAGERIIVRPQMRGATVVTSSMVPPVASTCEAGGSGWLNAVDAFTGTATVEAYFDVNRDGTFGTADKLTDTAGNLIGVGSVSTGGGAPTKGVFIENTMFFSKTDGKDGSEVTNGGGGLSRRVQWREILQD